MRRSRSWFALVLLTLSSLGVACVGAADRAEPVMAASADRMAWWREARFGLFIHWGLYAIPAGEWKDGTDYGEWIRHSAQIPVDEYDRFVAQFDPVDFDADEWVRAAKDAGMRYIVITTKHHDGFCLFDSELTDYDVMSTPFRRDIMAELAAACRREGLAIGWYHSIMDWHHPDYLPRRNWETRPADGADFERYRDHLHGQVEELLTNYGPIGVMWFDGEWEGTWNHDYGVMLYELCRELQPDVIVNNRVDKGRGGMAGLTEDARFKGDFGTPEQEIPALGLPGVDWETCMTMNRHWGYNRRDDAYKSSADLIRKLVDIASKGGNFLLNVGPTARGTFPAESLDRLAAIGDWMDVNGEAIHGTQGSPFAELPWGRCTQRAVEGGTRLYLSVFDWPAAGELVVPGLGSDVRAAHLLARPEPSLGVERRAGDVLVALPAVAPDPVATVVVLDIVGAPVVYEAPTITAESEVLVDRLEVRLEARSEGLDIRYTLDGSDPVAGSPAYFAPLELRASTRVKARTFHAGRPVSAVVERQFLRVEPEPATAVGELERGLRVIRYEGEWDALPRFEHHLMSDGWVAEQVRLRPGPSEEYYGLVFGGYVHAPADAVYRFALLSDDGSRLAVAGRVVVDNDGLHGAEERNGVIALAAGWHPLTVYYFNKTGGAELELRCGPIGVEPTPLEPARLGHEGR